MAKTASPSIKARVGAQKVTQGSGIPGLKKRPRPSKGKVLPRAWLYAAGFRQALQGGIDKIKVDFTKLAPISSVNELRAILIEGRRRLQAKNINAITASAWLGEVFEVIVERHPAVRDLQRWAAKTYVTVVNEYLSREDPRFVTLNGHFAKINVTKPFDIGTLADIENVRLVRPGQETGVQFFDSGRLVFNADGQALAMPTETKTRGAGAELSPQMADFDRRLTESPPGTMLEYTIRGQEGTHRLDLKELVLMRHRRNRGRSLDEEFFGRIGVVAGKQGIFSVRRDRRGRPYIRVKLPFDTDLLRRVIELVLRDKSLQ